MSVPEITVEELAAAMSGPINLIDVRQLDEYVDAHVPGAVLVELDTVPDRVDELSAMGPLVLICKSGARSMRAAEFLAGHGLDVTNVMGGTMAWMAIGYEVHTGSQP